MNTHILPTPDEIDAVIFDIIAAEAAQVPDDTSLDELWTSAVVAPPKRGKQKQQASKSALVCLP
jgi:hypothetical protein